LADLAAPRTGQLEFRLNNGSFESGDAEFLYQLIRARKPKRIFEVGSGNSTLVVHRAVNMNRKEMADYTCKHVCIEPFENPWLEQLEVTVLRHKIEAVDRALFQELEAGDLLFIDSSHVIRPQGDVLIEYLEILPTLKPGVIVHVHDVFSPRDYPAEWVLQNMWLWNEQYLLEAFLTATRSWKIIGAVNMLCHRHFDALRRVCPFLTPDREPGSFYMQKID
jgi:predicted O-methyltransferase YrrM